MTPQNLNREAETLKLEPRETLMFLKFRMETRPEEVAASLPAASNGSNGFRAWGL